MPFPFALAAQGALGLGRALFGGRKHNYNPHIDPFSFNPDANDPEIAIRRKNALLDIQRGHSDTVNEIGRAGLLGSSAAFGLLNQNQTQGNSELEDIPNSVFAKQRQDALTLYRDNANFQRQLALGEQGYDAHERMAGLDSLGDLGVGTGYSLDEHLAAKKKKYLDNNFDYSGYDNYYMH